MVRCTFCGGEVKQSRTIIIVDAAGRAHYFCGSKCKNNWKLKRDVRKVSWVRKKKK